MEVVNGKYFIEELLHDLTKKFNFEWNAPYQEWPEEAREAFLWGGQDISGLIEELERLFHETASVEIQRKVRQFLREDVCGDCHGKRLNPVSLGIRIGGKNSDSYAGGIYLRNAPETNIAGIDADFRITAI